MKSICLAVLWHQHQPSYRPGESSIAALPWARLHGIKDYVGMALLAERYPDFHHTINLVPCLLDQLEALAAGEATRRPGAYPQGGGRADAGRSDRDAGKLLRREH